MGVQTQGTEVHHMIFGTAKRKLADQDGLTVRLCNFHHRQLHTTGLYKEELQKIAEQSYLEYYNATIDDFIRRYGINYL